MAIALEHLILKQANLEDNLEEALDDVGYYKERMKAAQDKVAYCRKAIADIQAARKVLENA